MLQKKHISVSIFIIQKKENHTYGVAFYVARSLIIVLLSLYCQSNVYSNMVKKMNKKFIISTAIVAVLLISIGFRFFETKNSEKAQSEAIKKSMIPNVEANVPFEIETSSVIEAPGRIVAVKSADVIARVQGMVMSQHYKEGDVVKKGQLLYIIDPTEFQIAYDKAKANLDTAKAQQYQAQKDFERTKELVANDFVSKSEYDNALAARDAANATVKANIAAVNDARRLLSYTRVTAPITGKISLSTVTVGNFLSSPNTVLTKVVSIDPIYVTYSLDSGIFASLKGDEIIPNGKDKKPIKVEIKLPDGSIYDKTGNADFFDNVISETTGSITLRATFPNPESRLIPGDFVNVKVYSNKKIKRMAVPMTAVLQDTNGRYLFVIDENNVAHKRTIETDGEQGNNWIIKSGIDKNEKYVETGIIKVRDNVPVNIIQKQPAQEDAEPKNDEAKKQEE